MKATWNGAVIAESDDIVVVEGNAYFPLCSLKKQYFRDSTHTSVCGWKGTANYFDVVVGDAVNANAAWIYRTPKDAARQVTDRVGFWKGVAIGKE